MIPYQGTLFSQGKPVSQTEPIRMAFAIYSDDAGLEAGQESSAPGGEAREWTSWDAAAQGGDAVDALSETVGVQVRNGRFLVHLGETEAGQQPLADEVFDHETLYVVTWVMNEAIVYRLPPQKLNSVPHAVTAKRARNFEVTGELQVDVITPREPILNIQGGIKVTGPAVFEGSSFEINQNLDVTGITRLVSQRGLTGVVPADGRWHTIVSGLTALNVYEIVAHASKSRCHGLGHFIAMHVYRSSKIQKTTHYWTPGSSDCGVDAQYISTNPGNVDADISLQIRTIGDYAQLGNSTYVPQLRYSVTRLRFN